MVKQKAREIFWQMFAKKKQTDSENHIDFLRKISFFSNLTDWQLGRISEIIYVRKYDENEFVFEMDQPGAALFIIQSGEVAIELPSQVGRVQKIATLKEMDCLGDMALIDNSARSASARATQTTICYAFYRNDLESLMVTDPEIACKVYRSLASVVGTRLKAMNELVDEKETYEKVG